MSSPAGHGFATASARIDAIEEAYEYCLAYAAQGRRGGEAGASAEVRRFLQRALTALDGLVEAAGDEFARAEDGGEAGRAFLGVVRQDVDKARAAISLVLAQQAISSQLIDNLNASIHLRTLLTDLFLIDDSLKAGG